MPELTIIAGPNGSGKSTLSPLLAGGSLPIIDPDSIARGLSPADPRRAAIAAGRRTLESCAELLANRQSFILESTLAGHSALSTLRQAKAAADGTKLIYVALQSQELAIERVRLRVARGGHEVPDAGIRRRYLRSLAHAPTALRLAGEGAVFDNSGDDPVRQLSLRHGVIAWRADTVPACVERLIHQILPTA